jgi:hypothetical protein
VIFQGRLGESSDILFTGYIDFLSCSAELGTGCGEALLRSANDRNEAAEFNYLGGGSQAFS